MPFSVREGINIFLSGFVPTENMRFRDFELSFKVSEQDKAEQGEKQNKEETKEDIIRKKMMYNYPHMKKTLGPFSLSVEPGSFSASETIVMLGQNGTGKTTMIKMLAGLLKPDDDEVELPKLNVSYKP